MNDNDISKDKKKQGKIINHLDFIKSKKILKQIFDILDSKKELEMVKYNKKTQNRLNMTIANYNQYFQTEIEIIPAKDKFGEFININNEEEESYYHIFFDGNKEETIQYYLTENDDVKEIKVKIDFNINDF